MNIKRIIELIAPCRLLNFRNEPQIETTTGDIVCCECCNGEGGKYIDSRDHSFNFDKNNGDGYYLACKMCNGSGKVQPFISIEWKPAGEIKYIYKYANHS